MDMMFGGGGRRRGGGGGTKKGPDVVRPLPVSLEDLYCGATKKLKITRQTIDREVGVKKCKACDGQGFTYTQKRTTEVLEVNIQKGAPDGHKVTFHNKADEIPDGDAGDVVFVLKEKPH